MRWIVLGIALLLTSRAFAEAKPIADAPRRDVSSEAATRAAASFDLGNKAFQQEDYKAAADHYERADELVPHPIALEYAIRARYKAEQYDRTATLSVSALSRYPDETKLVELATELLEKTGPKLQRLSVHCRTDCNLTLDRVNLTPSASARDFTAYLAPGPHTLTARFGVYSNPPRVFVAEAGTTQNVEIETLLPKVQRKSLTKSPERQKALPPSTSSHALRSPVVFWVASGLTAVAAAATVWSGVDTANHPGPDRVRAECDSGDTSCPLYREGLANQRRTNYLLGATVLLGLSAAATATLLTDWNRGGTQARTTARKHQSTQQRFVNFKLDIGFQKRAELTFALKGQF